MQITDEDIAVVRRMSEIDRYYIVVTKDGAALEVVGLSESTSHEVNDYRLATPRAFSDLIAAEQRAYMLSEAFGLELVDKPAPPEEIHEYIEDVNSLKKVIRSEAHEAPSVHVHWNEGLKCWWCLCCVAEVPFEHICGCEIDDDDQ